jgi:glycosyltransferase involved in cell wall biosynthesis
MALQDIPLDAIVFYSDYERHRHVTAGLPLRESTVIHNGLDLRAFRNRPEGMCRPGGLRLLFVGRLTREKEAHHVVEATLDLLGRGYDITLSIAGIPVYPTAYADDLARVAAQHPAVRWLGAVQNSDRSAVHAEHDVLVFPSHLIEDMPVTVREAMAGLAVVATNAGGSAELLFEDAVAAATGSFLDTVVATGK